LTGTKTVYGTIGLSHSQKSKHLYRIAVKDLQRKRTGTSVSLRVPGFKSSVYLKVRPDKIHTVIDGILLKRITMRKRGEGKI